jgi:hypothetical protein
MDRLTTHLDRVVKMFALNFFILDNFFVSIAVNVWNVAKVQYGAKT